METKPAWFKYRIVITGLIVFVVVLIGILTVLLWYKPSAPATPVVDSKVSLVQPSLVTEGLSSPTSIAATPDSADKRLFVVEQAGTIRVIDESKQLNAEPFLDLSAKVLSGGEMGLLGLVFHPLFAQNGYFYVNYIDKDQQTVIARYTVSGGSGTANIASETILFTLKQPYKNHNGGALAFGPDGYLYIALGDGGSAGDPDNRAQNKDTYFGKIVRVDVTKGDPYVVPPNNPFINDSGSKPEIWAYGLRNPWRISFDKETGDLYIADVGQGQLEEINLQKASSSGGENYGWRCYEGNQPYVTDGCKDKSAYTFPILEYNHEEERCSVTGGYVYRGSQYPGLTGKYFYGDYCNGQLFYAENKNDRWSNVLAAQTSYSISTFGQGSDGELYFADFDTGSIYHIQDAAK
jgi:glucose/arabinose dehydrogenase